RERSIHCVISRRLLSLFSKTSSRRDKRGRKLMSWLESDEVCNDVFQWLDRIVETTSGITQEDAEELSAFAKTIHAATTATGPTQE
ncbi:hypothetical protein PMAYCL1PPCAC_10980, partial [Pristionchus mayeri]